MLLGISNHKAEDGSYWRFFFWHMLDHSAPMMMRLSGPFIFFCFRWDSLPHNSKKRSVSFSLTRLCYRPPKECKLQASAVKLWLGKTEWVEAREEKEKCCADKVILCAWAITAQSFIQCGQRHSVFLFYFIFFSWTFRSYILHKPCPFPLINCKLILIYAFIQSTTNLVLWFN